MENPFEKVAVARKKYQETIAALSDDFKTYLRTFMEAYPELEYVSWKQYTDYFNDGDACTFSVRRFSFKKVDTDDEDFEDQDIDEYWGDDKEPMIEALDELYQQVQADEELMLSLFGDHASVTITATEVTVTSYHNHD